MRITPLLAGALVCGWSAAALAAPTAHWRNGELICPDGGAGRPAIMPHARPTQQDLDNACFMRAQQKQLRTPLPGMHPMNSMPAAPDTHSDAFRRQYQKLTGAPPPR